MDAWKSSHPEAMETCITDGKLLPPAVGPLVETNLSNDGSGHNIFMAGYPVVGRNADGRLEVFALDARGNPLWHRWQISPGGAWSAWDSLGGSFITF